MPFDNPYFPQTFDVGTIGGGHMHFANDGSMTLYGPDGMTVLASLTPANGLQVFKGTITGALVQTAAAGNKRIALDGNANEIILNSGTAGETDGAIFLSHSAAGGSIAPYIEIDTPENAGVATTMRLTAGAGTIPRQVDFETDQFTVHNSTTGKQVYFDGNFLHCWDIQPDNLLIIPSFIGISQDRSTYSAPLAGGGTASITFLTNPLALYNSGYTMLFALTIRSVTGQWAPNSCWELFQVYREGGSAVVNYGASAFATVGSSAMTFGPANAANGVNIQATCAADGSSVTLTFKNNYAGSVEWVADMICCGQGA